MNYDEIVQCLGIKEGDRIWLSSELIRYIILFKKRNKTFDYNALINAFQEVIGENGTLLLPTFSFEFSNKKVYDYRNTKGTTGILGNIALGRPDFLRTQHPMHSFAVWGAEQEILFHMDNKHAFGTDSPFGYCMEKGVKQVILGTDYVHALAFIHYAEYMCNVPYRFSKSFTGQYIDKLGESEERTYNYAARKLEIEPIECFNKMGRILEEEKISIKVDIAGIDNYVVDLQKSYPVICNDIKNNMCRNIYDFNVPREEIF